MAVETRGVVVVACTPVVAVIDGPVVDVALVVEVGRVVAVGRVVDAPRPDDVGLITARSADARAPVLAPVAIIAKLSDTMPIAPRRCHLLEEAFTRDSIRRTVSPIPSISSLSVPESGAVSRESD